MRHQNSDARPDEFVKTKPFSETSDKEYRLQGQTMFNKLGQVVPYAVGIGRRDGARYIIEGHAYTPGLKHLGQYDPEKDAVVKPKEKKPRSPLSKPDKSSSEESDGKSSSESDLLD